MTLIVYPVRFQPDGTCVNTDLEPRPPHNDLFGVETMLRTWIRLAKQHDLRLMRRLEEPLPVFFRPEELAELADETAHLRSRVEEAGVQFRLGNLLEAIRLAQSLPGGMGGVTIG